MDMEPNQWILQLLTKFPPATTALVTLKMLFYCYRVSGYDARGKKIRMQTRLNTHSTRTRWRCSGRDN